MKFGVHAGLWMARWTDDVAPILRVVADLGFDEVEVSLRGMTDDRAAGGASGTLFSHVIDALMQAGATPLPAALSRATAPPRRSCGSAWHGRATRRCWTR